MSRYFLAISPPDPIRDSLTALRPPSAAGVKRVDSAQIHLTLHFLGELFHDQLDSVVAVVEETRFPPFSLLICGLGTFPPEKPPRIIWAGVEESPELSTLHRELGQRLTEAIGYEPESRPFKPHLTLARIKATANRPLLDAHLKSHENLSVPGFEVSRISLFQSQITETGPSYEIIAQSPVP